MRVPTRHCDRDAAHGLLGCRPVRLATFLFGRRLATDEERTEQLGTLSGVPYLGLDALASASYGPEAALTVLLPLGALSVHYIGPISLVLIAVLTLVYVSYRQTIAAYPGGGGSYTVAKENLGTTAGLVAASALLIDYVLNVAVAISAGVGALVSAVPGLLPHTLSLCLVLLAVLALVNLRGARSSGVAFLAPTYVFLATLFTVIAIGIAKTVAHGGHPIPEVPPRAVTGTVATASAWLLVRAFANGCTAMTGVEAVSNGVPAFRPPAPERARRTLGIIVGSLVLLLAGVAFLSRVYGVTATVSGEPGYQSVISQMVGAVMGRGPFYYVALGSVVAVLCLSANTSFADFPRLCRILAADGFLPQPFAVRGRRLAFSIGIAVLATLATTLLLVFRGLTEGLIPLFAVGALLAFTMSQAGMAAHWRRMRGQRRHLAINAVGAAATGITLGIVLVSKFIEGAWMTVLLVVAMFVLFRKVRSHYDKVEATLATDAPLELGPEPRPIVVVPLRRWTSLAQKGLHVALEMSDDVHALQILTDDLDGERDLNDVWDSLVRKPAEKRGLVPPKLVVLRSPYRELYGPILRYVTRLARAHPNRQIAVVVPQLVESRWYYRLLHANTALILQALLLLHRGNQDIVVINTPVYMT
jgi:amino acid transporter